MVLILLRLGEVDAHRHALHHLDVVPGRILRRKQAQHRSCGATDLCHDAIVVATVHIYVNLHLLIGPHQVKLGLLEVRRHPQILQGDQRDQVLPHADVLAHFDVLGGDDSVHRRDDLGVAQVELCLIQLGARLFHLRRCLVRLGLLHLQQAGRVTGVARGGLRRRQIILRDSDLIRRSSSVGLGGDDRRLICLRSSHSLIVLLLGDHVLSPPAA